MKSCHTAKESFTSAIFALARSFNCFCSSANPGAESANPGAESINSGAESAKSGDGSTNPGVVGTTSGAELCSHSTFCCCLLSALLFKSFVKELQKTRTLSEKLCFGCITTCSAHQTFGEFPSQQGKPLTP